MAERAVQASGDCASAFNEILRRRAAHSQWQPSPSWLSRSFGGDLTRPPAAGRRSRQALSRGGVRSGWVCCSGLHQALRLGKRCSYVGFGDRDAICCNPLYLLDFLRQSGNTPIVLLHCYPTNEAGYLAQAFNVYLD